MKNIVLMTKNMLAPLLLLLLGLIWGASYTLARYAITHGIPPLGYACWQVIGPLFFLVIHCSIRHYHFKWSFSCIPFFLFVGLIGNAVPNTNMFFCAQHVSASLLAIVMNTTPFFIYLIALISKEERWSWFRFLLLTLLLFGIYFMTSHHFDSQFLFHKKSYWLLLGLLSPFCFAASAVLVAHKGSPYPAAVLSLGMLLVSTVMIVALTLGMHDFYWPSAGWRMRDWILLYSVILSVFNYIITFALIKAEGSVYFSFVNGIAAVAGVIIGLVFLTERFKTTTLLAMVVIIAATVLMIVAQYRRNSLS